MNRALATLLATTLATPAFPYLPPGGSLAAGFVHPFLGLDHVLVMVAVGLWGAMMGTHARWALPTAFVGSAMTGFIVAILGALLPFVEPMILLSILLLGFAVALALRPPVVAAATAVAIFGVFHGHAHGAEVGSAGVLAFGAGFAASTAVLHGVGIAAAYGLSRSLRHARLLRGLGWITALGGLWVASGV